MKVQCTLVLLCVAGYNARNTPSPANSIVMTFKAPANLTYEELQYIYRARNGDQSDPPKSLSPCARAILGCCKKSTIDPECSEELECGAFFFDDNPCEEKFVVDALKAAKAFYSQFQESA